MLLELLHFLCLQFYYLEWILILQVNTVQPNEYLSEFSSSLMSVSPHRVVSITTTM